MYFNNIYLPLYPTYSFQKITHSADSQFHAPFISSFLIKMMSHCFSLPFSPSNTLPLFQIHGTYFSKCCGFNCCCCCGWWYMHVCVCLCVSVYIVTYKTICSFCIFLLCTCLLFLLTTTQYN